MRFALFVTQDTYPDGTVAHNITAANEGVPEAEILMSLEAWHSELKKRVMKDRTFGIHFGDPDD